MNETKERVGVYVCHCGSNIAGVVDVESVANFAAEDLKDRGVVLARDYTFMCSVAGQELIEQDIHEQRLTRVVVAACSPHLHEKTFRGVCERSGLNPYLSEMASIREQVAWVHTDKIAATAKAKAIVNGTVERVLKNEPLEAIRVPIDAATLVVGGGIAGLQAALEVAEAGYEVYLIEREASLGGHMAQFDKTFPTLDCAACILTPKMAAAGSHPKIHLFTWSEVEKVEGFVGNYTVTVKKKPRYVDEDICTGCGICVEKCPIMVVDDNFEAGIGYRKAIYWPFAQAVPNLPVLDPETCTYFIGAKTKDKGGGCKACEKFCPTVPNSILLDQKEERVTLRVGNIILATGWELFNARRIPQYGYGRLPNVFTSLELERMCNAAGPTGGKVVLRDGQTAPKAVGIVHCVGSRDRNYNPYCSSICCMQSLKTAHLVKERTGAEVYNFYIDIRTPGKDYDEFYQHVMDESVHFIRGKVAEVTDVPMGPQEEAGKLFIQVDDTLAGLQRRIPVDMVVLSAGLEPRHDSAEVGKIFGIACSTRGWFIEKHAKMDPISTMTEGVFVAGCAQGPKDIPASVSQGAAAAARVLNYIRQGELALEPVRASVIAEQCSGCRLCNGLCPFNAISFNEEHKVTEINAALCQGCGTCVAACPAGAIQGSGFSNEQLFAQIEGLLHDVRQPVSREAEVV
jgi:heterodisulfide reductase subunit A